MLSIFKVKQAQNRRKISLFFLKMTFVKKVAMHLARTAPTLKGRIDHNIKHALCFTSIVFSNDYYKTRGPNAYELILNHLRNFFEVNSRKNPFRKFAISVRKMKDRFRRHLRQRRMRLQMVKMIYNKQVEMKLQAALHRKQEQSLFEFASTCGDLRDSIAERYYKLKETDHKLKLMQVKRNYC
jgi:hypothetical protein